MATDVALDAGPTRAEAIRRSAANLLESIRQDANATLANEKLFRDTFAVPSYERTSAWLEDASRTMDKIIWGQFCERILVRWSINLCFGINCPNVRKCFRHRANALLAFFQFNGSLFSLQGRRLDAHERLSDAGRCPTADGALRLCDFDAEKVDQLYVQLDWREHRHGEGAFKVELMFDNDALWSISTTGCRCPVTPRRAR